MPTLPPKPAPRPSFVSTQVTEARRYYLDLTPSRERELAVVCGGCERVQPDYVIQRNTFPFLAVEFVAEGGGELTLAGRKYRLQPGMAFAYAPGVPHLIRNDPEAPMLKYYVDFAGHEGERRLAESPLGTWRPVQVSSPQEIVAIFEMLQREGGGEGRRAPEICAALLPALLLIIGERAVSQGPAEPRALASFLRAKHLLERRFLELKTIEQAAAACHMDGAYLCRLFRRFGQVPPYRFLVKLKMNRAIELLLDQRLMVKEVADALGFADAFHFSRTFKRIYGLSPERFVQQARARRG